jgi:hypothetical protein
MAIKSATFDSEFTIFSRFSQAFSHVVRGDLSVVTNELSYLATRLPSEDLSRVKNRCAQMAATISRIAGLESALRVATVEASVLSRVFGASSEPGLDQVFLSYDPVKIERLATIVRQMCGDGSSSWTTQVDRDTEAFRISFVSPRRNESEETRQFHSWSDFASRVLGERSVIDGVVADLIMRAHGWGIWLSVTSCAVEGFITVPLVAKEQFSLRSA